MVSLAVALMVLGVFCHNKTDIQDEVLDWPRLVREMSQLKYCLGNSSQLNPTKPGSVERASLDNVPVFCAPKCCPHYLPQLQWSPLSRCYAGPCVVTSSVTSCRWRGAGQGPG